MGFHRNTNVNSSYFSFFGLADGTISRTPVAYQVRFALDPEPAAD